jgi:2,3,4,5-tetrahydropyridine-2-carboxylate N-succinyltransferase
MIDSHALVGSCAQVGKARAPLAPGRSLAACWNPGADPVIVEDNAFIGGNTGI